MRYAYILFIAAIVTSCSKHKDDFYPTIPVATVTLSEPVESSVFHPGDTITIKASAVSKTIIHGCDILIKKVNDTTVYFTKHIHDHNDTIIINHKWKNILAAPAQLEAQLTFHLDHDGNTAVKKVRFLSR